jgi:hypothetical protein
MNPYLEHESVWHDFHERYIPAIAEEIGAQVDPRYIVRIDEHVYVREAPDDPRRLVGRSDVLLSRPPTAQDAAAGAALLEPPVEVQLPAVDLERLAYIEILDREDWRLVTVVELLSPSNKASGADRDQYLAKRAQLLSSRVNVVEIDLLRGGPRLPLRDLPPCDYYVLVSRAEQRPRAGVWPVKLRDPLPVAPIPLQPADADARLDLQGVLHRVYDAARYRTYIYLREPQPRLQDEDRAWARQFVPGTTS